MRRTLRNDPDFPANLREFLVGLRAAIADDTAALAKLMTGCKVMEVRQPAIDDAGDARLTSESLMQDMLMLDFMQADLKDVLLGKLRDLAAAEE